MKLVVGISGASGAIYGVRILEVLRQAGVETHLVMSDSGKRTVAYETDYSVEQVKDLASHVHSINDVGACISSGSFKHNGMVIAPCSIKTLSALANSFNTNLLIRDAEGTAQAGPDGPGNAAASRPSSAHDPSDGNRCRARSTIAGVLSSAANAGGRHHPVGEQGARSVRPGSQPLQTLDRQRGA